MPPKKLKWFYLIAVITLMGVSLLTSPAFAENKGGIAKEGINVHGHWKIEIFNPDGKRASITEFENSLDSGMGAMYLAGLLSGETVHGSWGIELDSTSGAKPCDVSGSAEPCRIGETGAFYASLGLNSLNLNVSDNWSMIRQVVLSGSVTADYASTINKVMTLSNYCIDKNVSITSCRTVNNMIWQTFTSTTLVTPPSVVPGQLIQVTVTLSFS